MGLKAILFFEPVNHVYKVMLAAADMGYAVVVMHQMKLFAPKPYERSLESVAVDVEVDDWFDEEALLEQARRCTEGYDVQGTYTALVLLKPSNNQLSKCFVHEYQIP